MVSNTLAYYDMPKNTAIVLYFIKTVACTINIYDRRFYYRNDIGLYYNTLEMIVIDDPSLS